jgi:hypothetical protein
MIDIIEIGIEIVKGTRTEVKGTRTEIVVVIAIVTGNVSALVIETERENA